MKLKDIVLKKGDIVYFADNSWQIIRECENDKTFGEAILPYITANKIYKIERPVKYKTIYEAPKQILDKEEKGIIKEYLLPLIKKDCYIIKQNDGEIDYLVLKLKREPNLSLDQDKMYKGMELDKEYTLEELGLFEGVNYGRCK